MSAPALSPACLVVSALLAFGPVVGFDVEMANFCSIRMEVDGISESSCFSRLSLRVSGQFCLRVMGGSDEEIDWPSCIEKKFIRAQIVALQHKFRIPRNGK